MLVLDKLHFLLFLNNITLSGKHTIGFVLQKKVFIKYVIILVFRLKFKFDLGKIGFVWVRFGFVFILVLATNLH